MNDLPQPTQAPDPDLQKKHTLVFTKQELIIIFNAIVKQSYPLGAAKAIIPVIDKIEPLVVQESNIPEDKE